MENTPQLYDTLMEVYGQHNKWLDKRHLKTLVWIVIGVILSAKISITEWVPYAVTSALAASTQRRFSRWLHNERIEVNSLYAPLIYQAISTWDAGPLYLALDTSMLWNKYCLIRISVIYRGRAVPLVWSVIEHPSSTVSFDAYRPLLDQSWEILSECACYDVVFLADRGFAETELMEYLSKQLGWHWRIRIKKSFKVRRKGHRTCNIRSIFPPAGHAHFLKDVLITDGCFGPVSLAIASHHSTGEEWIVASDEPTTVETFDEYGLRFDIEENFLDDKSNGFQLESSRIRSAKALERLCLVLAMATLYLVSQGTAVVSAGKRRLVDPHWFRGNSYLKIGWKWVKRAVIQGEMLTRTLFLDDQPDPELAISSKNQWHNLPDMRFTVTFFDFSTTIPCQDSA